jgi:hypothetical protein
MVWDRFLASPRPVRTDEAQRLTFDAGVPHYAERNRRSAHGALNVGRHGAPLSGS